MECTRKNEWNVCDIIIDSSQNHKIHYSSIKQRKYFNRITKMNAMKLECSIFMQAFDYTNDSCFAYRASIFNIFTLFHFFFYSLWVCKIYFQHWSRYFAPSLSIVTFFLEFLYGHTNYRNFHRTAFDGIFRWVWNKNQKANQFEAPLENIETNWMKSSSMKTHRGDRRHMTCCAKRCCFVFCSLYMFVFRCVRFCFVKLWWRAKQCSFCGKILHRRDKQKINSIFDFSNTKRRHNFSIQMW